MDERRSIIRELKDKLGSVVGQLNKLELEENKKQQEQSANEPELALVGKLPYRVIHLKGNPMDLQVSAMQSEFEHLKRENDRLRARCELLECGNDADVTRRIDGAINQTHRIEVLTRKVKDAERYETKLLDSIKKTSREFREVCYLLTGYRVDALQYRTFRLSHMYAENEADTLLFQVGPGSLVQLLETEYSNRLSEQIETYLENGDSFPAFLASITMDLYKSSTQLAPMSMSMTMSTTTVPNPDYNPHRR